jgi:site-specific DNA-methyltransferase (adenine-specific)
MLSSVKMDWETPKELYDKLDKEFGFTLDFCATELNKKHNHFYSEEQDALKQNPNKEIIFCNPPYGNRIKDFVKKCSELGNNNIVVMLIPARTDTLYFHEYIYGKAEIRFIKGRIKFIGNQKGSGSAPFPSMIVIFRRLNKTAQEMKA